MRRDNTGGAQLYQKTSGIHVNTGWVALAGAVVTTPTGALHIYGGTTAPTGWLLCDGSAVSRATYADLFGAIGTNFGSGDGSTTFNLPDMRGRVPVGYAASGGQRRRLNTRPQRFAGSGEPSPETPHHEQLDPAEPHPPSRRRGVCLRCQSDRAERP